MRIAALLVGSVLVASCGDDSPASSDPIAADAEPPPSTASPAPTIAPTTTGPDPSFPELDPADWVVTEEEICTPRAEAVYTEEEFRFDPLEPLAEPVFPGATRHEARGHEVIAPDGSATVVLETGASSPTLGASDLLRIIESTAPDAAALHVWENCPVDEATPAPVVVGDRLLVGQGGLPGLVVLDLATGEPLGAVTADAVPVGADPLEPGSALVLVRQWASGRVARTESGSAMTMQPVTLRSMGLDTLELGPAILEVEPPAAVWPDVFVFDDTVLIRPTDGLGGGDATLHRVADGAVTAVIDGLTMVELGTLSLADGRLWATESDMGRVVALDPETLEIVTEVPMDDLGRAAARGDAVWVTTVDTAGMRGSLLVIDTETGEVTEVLEHDLYTRVGRGGEYTWTPYPRPVEGGVVMFDERAGSDWFIADPRTVG